MVDPVAARIGAAADIAVGAFLFAGADLGRHVAQRQTAAAARGAVGGRAVQEQVGVQGHLAGAHDKGHWLAAPLERIVDALPQDVLLLGRAVLKGNLAVQMRAGDDGHRPVFLIYVVDGQPSGHYFARGQGPVRGVLVPSDLFLLARLLAKVVGHDADEVGAEEVFDVIENARLVQQVVDAPAVAMPAVDRIAVVPVGLGLDHERVEIAAIGRGFLGREHVQGADVALFIELADLGAGELLRVVVGGAEKFELALHVGEGVGDGHGVLLLSFGEAMESLFYNAQILRK